MRLLRRYTPHVRRKAWRSLCVLLATLIPFQGATGGQILAKDSASNIMKTQSVRPRERSGEYIRHIYAARLGNAHKMPIFT
jgi:hypothetical protein